MRTCKNFRWMIIPLLFVLLLALASCMNDKVKAPEDQTGSQPAVDVTVGVEKDNHPWFYTGEDSRGKGIYADLVGEIMKDQGLSYRFLELDPVAAREALEAGSINCYLGSLLAPVGEELGLWQSPVLFQSALSLAVPKDSSLSGPADLAGRQIAAAKGGPEERYALILAGKYQADLVTFPSSRDVLADTDQGLSAALAADYAWLKEKGEAWSILESSGDMVKTHCFYTLDQDPCAAKLSEGISRLTDSGRLTEFTALIPQP